MKVIITFLFLVFMSPLFADVESAIEVAKRVIVDQSTARRPSGFNLFSVTGTGPPIPGPKDQQLKEAAARSADLIKAYMLGDTVPEKVRIAYAISVLSKKRVPMTEEGSFAPSGDTLWATNIDPNKNIEFLKDGLVLAARLAEIEKSEAETDTQSKSPAAEIPTSK